jgi:hypothetical protein
MRSTPGVDILKLYSKIFINAGYSQKSSYIKKLMLVFSELLFGYFPSLTFGCEYSQQIFKVHNLSFRKDLLSRIIQNHC